MITTLNKYYKNFLDMKAFISPTLAFFFCKLENWGLVSLQCNVLSNQLLVFQLGFVIFLFHYMCVTLIDMSGK